MANGSPLFDQVVALAQSAGQGIMSVYHRVFSVQQKADNSPVTEADLLAHHLILQGLQQLTPDIPVLSEESTAIDWDERRHWQRYWLVDPLDGTKEFVRHNDEFTVNIALIHDGLPIWGVVDAPALKVTYYGGPAVSGSWRRNSQGLEPIRVGALPKGRAGWRVMGSRSHPAPALADYLSAFEQPDIRPMGSSLKICLVAEGEAHIYPRLGPTSEWDTAAAHAVLLGAGGKLIDPGTDESLVYNRKPSLLNPFFIAAPEAYNRG